MTSIINHYFEAVFYVLSIFYEIGNQGKDEPMLTSILLLKQNMALESPNWICFSVYLPKTLKAVKSETFRPSTWMAKLVIFGTSV